MLDLNIRNVGRWHTVELLTLGALCLAGNAWSASFEWIKPLPTQERIDAMDVSDDGKVVVGYSESVSGGKVTWEAFRWTQETGVVGLGLSPGGDHSFAYGVSADGSVIVGVSGDQAFRWTEATGMVGLGFLPGGNGSIAYGVSADGTVVVGGSNDASDALKPVIWTDATGMKSLALLPGYDGGIAADVSADGTVVMGPMFGGGDDYQAFRWTEAAGMVGLGSPSEGGVFIADAGAVSADGSTIVGRGGPSSYEPYRWTVGEGFLGLGFLPGGKTIGDALDVSGDGSVIVGYGYLPNPHRERPFIWDASHGMRDLGELLTQLGVDLGGLSPARAHAITPDGLTIVGITEWGNSDSWIAHGPFAPTVGEGEISVDPTFALFLDQAVSDGPSAPYTITIGNTGTGDLNITSVGKTGAGAPHFVVTSDTGQTTLAPAEERLIDVVFDPSSVGDKQAFLSIESDDPTTPVVHVYLWGHAYAGGEIQVTPTAYTWPYQSIPDAPALPGTVTITNSGAGSLSLSGVALTGTSPGQFIITDDTGETSLSTSQSRMVDVAFNPSTLGGKNALLRITSNDADEPTVDVTLTGTGFDPVAGYTSPVWVDASYTGTEMGSETQPYNTLAEGVDLVLTGGTVKVKPGASDEALRISKPLRIEATGASASFGK